MHFVQTQEKEKTVSLLVAIDKKSSTPLFRQIADKIAELVAQGVLKPGDNIPPTRELAQKLEVNRSTVYRAYQELWAWGYVESRPGSYSTIRKRKEIVADPEDRDPTIIDWQACCATGPRELNTVYWRNEGLLERMRKRAEETGEAVDFATLCPDSRLLPVDEYRKCINDVLVNEGESLLQYGSPQGYEPLREFIASRMQLHSISVSKDDILITNGAQNGIELALRLLAGPEGKVMMEAPAYSRAMDVLRSYEMEMVPVPVKEDGMDLTTAEKMITKCRPSAIYTIPNFHNPTGITTDHHHREKLLSICEEHRLPLIEDGFEEEMKYFGKSILPIKSMDRKGVVIYIGTFSKVLFPGLRTGWIAADRECIKRLVSLQKTSFLSGNPLDQAALHRFCENGHYDLHIKRMHRVYRRRMTTVLKAMEELFPAGKLSWTRPVGGYTLWVKVSGSSVTEEELMMQLADSGVLVSPGSAYLSPDNAGMSSGTTANASTDGIYFRLSIACTDEEDIRVGIQRVAEAVMSKLDR